MDHDPERVEINDGARYSMMGNAVTVNVAHWIGSRILITEEEEDEVQ